MTTRGTIFAASLIVMAQSSTFGCLSPRTNAQSGSRVPSRGATTPTSSPANPSTQSAGEQARPGAGDSSTPIVSLTYDDALPTQLSVVAPALKAHHLRATFFVTDVRGNKEGWAALKKDAHELGAHTFNHPCTKAMAWVPKGKASEDYDTARMAKELDDNIQELRDLGQSAPFSFAYPCGTNWIGEGHESYVSLVKQRFVGARGVVPGVVTQVGDAYEIPASFVSGSGAELIRVVDGARREKGWVVFGFHGVGGDANVTPTESHEALLQYLDDHKRDVQVLPFGEALSCKLPAGAS